MHKVQRKQKGARSCHAVGQHGGTKPAKAPQRERALHAGVVGCEGRPVSLHKAAQERQRSHDILKIMSSPGPFPISSASCLEAVRAKCVRKSVAKSSMAMAEKTVERGAGRPDAVRPQVNRKSSWATFETPFRKPRLQSLFGRCEVTYRRCFWPNPVSLSSKKTRQGILWHLIASYGPQSPRRTES